MQLTCFSIINSVSHICFFTQFSFFFYFIIHIISTGNLNIYLFLIIGNDVLTVKIMFFLFCCDRYCSIIIFII